MARNWVNLTRHDSEYYYNANDPHRTMGIETYTDTPGKFFISSNMSTDGRSKDIGPFDSFEAAVACYATLAGLDFSLERQEGG